MDSIDFSDLQQKGYTEIVREFPPDFDHYCIGCSESNPISLKIRFFEKKGTTEIVTKHIVKREYCGFPNFTHGGISTTMLDEIMAYSAYAVKKQFGLTKWIKSYFLKPVKIGVPLFLISDVVKTEETKNGLDVHLESFIYEGNDESGLLCMKAESVYVILPPERFNKMVEIQMKTQK
jgi:acyl-CoA hydrolase